MINSSGKEAAIVVMAYKENLTKNETISFLQCCNILSNYDIILVAPKTMSIKSYINLSNNSVKFKIQRFDDDFFISTKTYNKLMLDVDFYQCFSEYEYILIYQLDAFVFRDSLSEFLSLGFDYIGAPWIDGMLYYRYDSKWPILINKIISSFNQPVKLYVGNGGLSLRKVQAFISLLRNNKEANTWSHNEDIYYSLKSLDHKTLCAADLKTALNFSFELFPEKCYALNDFTVPFGCHAWEKHGASFWKKFIEGFGWKVI